jgi:YVTN family beta-propeller protein
MRICAALALFAVLAVGRAAEPHAVYVSNEMSGDLSIIDGVEHRIVATVPLGKRPRGIQASPDRSLLYVALSGSPLAPPGTDRSLLPAVDPTADGIGVFSIAERSIKTIIRGVSDPEQLAVGHDGRLLYIASEDTGSAVIADATSGEIVAGLPAGGEPEGIAISPDGRFVYVASEEDSRVTVIDTAAQQVVADFAAGSRPRAVAFSPDGTRAYVSGELDRSVSVVDTSEHRVIAVVELPAPDALPMGVAVSPDGATVYVTTGRGGTLVAIDTASLQITGTAQVGTRPWGVALSPLGLFAYTANGLSDDISVVDTATMQVVRTIPVGVRPWGVAVVAGD